MGLLITSALKGLAQSREANRLLFYIAGSRGVSKHVMTYNGTLGATPGHMSFGLWRPTVGFFVSPRLAIEYSWLRKREYFEQIGRGVRADGKPITGVVRDENRAWAIPITLRYRIRPRENQRFQLEALVGLSYVSQSVASESYRTDDEEILDYWYLKAKGRNFYVMAGIAGRFALGKHLEVVGDYGFNRMLKNMDGGVSQQVIGNSTGLTRNRSIGLRYRFNFKINKPAPKETVTE
ncbi:outer membrane beta-barrel protein [Hymenobacter psychrotolerans]|nr:outer membrane beta-barrel protein [Hymenobacter psychrotolerans]